MELDRSPAMDDAPKLMDEEKISGSRNPPRKTRVKFGKKKSMTTVSKILRFDRLGTNRRKFWLS